jgi:hypothetical protein
MDEILCRFQAKSLIEPYEIDAGPTQDDVDGACQWAMQFVANAA